MQRYSKTLPCDIGGMRVNSLVPAAFLPHPLAQTHTGPETMAGPGATSLLCSGRSCLRSYFPSGVCTAGSESPFSFALLPSFVRSLPECPFSHCHHCWLSDGTLGCQGLDPQAENEKQEHQCPASPFQKLPPEFSSLVMILSCLDVFILGLFL